MKTHSLFLAIALLITASLAHAEPSKVTVKTQGRQAALMVDGKPFEVRGVTFTLTGPSGPSKFHCSPVDSSV